MMKKKDKPKRKKLKATTGRDDPKQNVSQKDESPEMSSVISSEAVSPPLGEKVTKMLNELATKPLSPSQEKEKEKQSKDWKNQKDYFISCLEFLEITSVYIGTHNFKQQTKSLVVITPDHLKYNKGTIQAKIKLFLKLSNEEIFPSNSQQAKRTYSQQEKYIFWKNEKASEQSMLYGLTRFYIYELPEEMNGLYKYVLVLQDSRFNKDVTPLISNIEKITAVAHLISSSHLYLVNELPPLLAKNLNLFINDTQNGIPILKNSHKGFQGVYKFLEDKGVIKPKSIQSAQHVTTKPTEQDLEHTNLAPSSLEISSSAATHMQTQAAQFNSQSTLTPNTQAMLQSILHLNPSFQYPMPYSFFSPIGRPLDYRNFYSPYTSASQVNQTDSAAQNTEVDILDNNNVTEMSGETVLKDSGSKTTFFQSSSEDSLDSESDNLEEDSLSPTKKTITRTKST